MIASPDHASSRILPFGGGKGGVGKTFLTANVAVALARAGRRVVAVDLDLEGANLHTCLGVPQPHTSLADYVARREEDLGKLLVETPVANLWLVAATHGHAEAPQPGQSRRLELMRALRRVPADFVLLDLGAGAHPAVMDYFTLSADGVVVITPEPTSVENAYAFLRAALYRRLRLSAVSLEARRLVGIAMDRGNERGIRSPYELVREVQSLDPAEGERFLEVLRSFRPRLVVNDVRSAEDIRLGFSVCSVCRKFFGIDPQYLGYVNHDEAARRSVRARAPVVDAEPRSDAAIYVERMAAKLLAPGRRIVRAAAARGAHPR